MSENDFMFVVRPLDDLLFNWHLYRLLADAHPCDPKMEEAERDLGIPHVETERERVLFNLRELAWDPLGSHSVIVDPSLPDGVVEVRRNGVTVAAIVGISS